MKGPRLCLQSDYGTYAESKGSGGSPALSPLMPWETHRCRGCLRVGQSVRRQRSTAAQDSIRLEVIIGGTESAYGDYVGAA